MLFRSLSSLFGGGKGATAGTTTVGMSGLLSGNAVGTANWSGGLTYVNENGREIMDLPSGTRIYPAAESRRMMAANDVAPRGGDTHYHFSGNLMTPEFWERVQAGDAQAATQGAAGGAQISQAEAGRAAARQLGRFGRR